MRQVLLLFCLATMSAFSADTWAEDDVLGYWAGPSSILMISRQAEQLSAKVIALKDPTYLDTEDVGTPGEVRLDDQNPDPELKARPILGLELLSEYRHDGKRWEGKIYDPESGNTYSSRMEVDGDGNLKMRGYIGMPMFGRTAVFQPLSLCTADMQAMLTKSARAAEDCSTESQP